MLNQAKNPWLGSLQAPDVKPILLLSRHSLKLPSIVVALYPQFMKLSDLIQKRLCIADSGWLSQKLTTVQSTKKNVPRVLRRKGDI